MDSGFVARISRRAAARSRSKRQHRKVQWLARTRECAYVFWLQPLLLGETLGQILGQPKTVAPGIAGNISDRLARNRARSQRIFVGVNDHRILGKGTTGKGG